MNIVTIYAFIYQATTRFEIQNCSIDDNVQGIDRYTCKYDTDDWMKLNSLALFDSFDIHNADFKNVNYDDKFFFTEFLHLKNMKLKNMINLDILDQRFLQNKKRLQSLHIYDSKLYYIKTNVFYGLEHLKDVLIRNTHLFVLDIKNTFHNLETFENIIIGSEKNKLYIVNPIVSSRKLLLNANFSNMNSELEKQFLCLNK